MDATDEKKEAHRKLPEAKTLGEAGDVLIKDKDGKELPLKSLYTDQPGDERQLIVFIRHFYCGSCRQYMEALARDLPPEKLAKAKVSLSVVGCGEHVCIEDYAKETGATFPIYADPSVRTYKILGMMASRTPGSTTPSYLYRSVLDNFFTSLWGGLTSKHPLSGGPSAQNGGEWLFQGGELKWCHRMRNPTDHTETEELKKMLGVE